MFLRSARTTLVAAISIPLSIMIAIAVFGVAGLTINILTLGGLAVAVGRVVDDSIVVLENIYRHRGLGDDRRDAVITGTREVAGAITSSTITTVAVFLPIGFVGGIVSQFFLPFGLAVTFALLASLIVALTVIPVLAYFFVDRIDVQLGRHGELPETIWQRLYTPVLAAVAAQPHHEVGHAGHRRSCSSSVAMSLAPLLPTAFIDAGGENFLSVTVSPPQGASTAGVRERTEQAEAILLDEARLPESSWSSRRSRATPTPAPRRSRRPSRAAPRTAPSSRSASPTTWTLRHPARTSRRRSPRWRRTASRSRSRSRTPSAAAAASRSSSAAQDAADIKARQRRIVAELSTMDGVDNVGQRRRSADRPRSSWPVDPNRAALIGSSTAQIAAETPQRPRRASPSGATHSRTARACEAILRVDDSGVDSVEGLRQMPVSGIVGSLPLDSSPMSTWWTSAAR